MEQYPRVARAAAVAAVAAEAAQQNALHRVEDKQQHGGAPAAAPAAAKASSVATDAGVNGRPTPPEEEIGPPPRFFSPRVCARIMGFPDSFRLPKVPRGSRISKWATQCALRSLPRLACQWRGRWRPRGGVEDAAGSRCG